MQMAVPRWKVALEKALAAHSKSSVIQLASIDPSTPVPHVRSLIFRGWVSPTDNPTHPLLLATTDVRTPKTAQMIANPHVQIVWWIDGSQEQYRIAGTAHIIPSPGHVLHKHFLHTIQPFSEGETYDWEAKRIEVFKSMSPMMKASWCRPTPGSRLEGGEDEAKKWPTELEEPKPGDEEGKRLWEMSLSNFALVIVEPQDVDYIELKPIPNRRTRFWRPSEGVWNEEALVP
ncbi:Pyridox-oxase-2 domain-containing protein [Mycena sanguinolenta]|uniref:Pyridox-oxase-2 domain-containing protein n=1 Tax=Mycena sanguinolenta TaxID=230812 RepID=A0A8H6YW01_9AGAR|nr:Pyridox-oxase-2 domain-containing protein [Mycena sanguinolenta]